MSRKIFHKSMSFLSECVMHDVRALRSRVFLFVFNLIPDLFSLAPIRNVFLKCGGAKLGLFRAYVRSPLYCNNLSQISFGDGTFINMGCRFEGSAPIVIGAHCKIGPFCCFENVNHRGMSDQHHQIVIGDGVWFGAGVIVTPGVRVSNNAVVAAGAVLVNEIGESELWGGVPARKIKDVDNEGVTSSELMKDNDGGCFE